MKTHDMSSVLRAFANLADAHQGEELRRFATIFDGGKEETVTARVNRVLKGLEVRGYPARLKQSLLAIEAGLSATGKNGAKAANEFKALLLLFEGSSSDTVDNFVGRVTAALAAPPKTTPHRKKPEQLPDDNLVRELSDELAKKVLDADAFARVVDRLRDAKKVSTPTLHAVANRFLANSEKYTGRKTAIDAIGERQKQDARIDARGKALDRVGV